MSKFSLNGMTQLVAAEINGDIKINAIDLGWLSTDMGGPSAPSTLNKQLNLSMTDYWTRNTYWGFFRGGKRID